MFEQSAPKDWSRAFPPAEDESPSDSAEPAAGPAKSPFPPMPNGRPAPIPPEPPPPPPPGATTGTPGTATGSSGGTSAIADSRG